MKFGLNIAVLDKGFVYIGDCERQDDLLFIYNAKCIIKWGTERGLNQLFDGPTKNTKLSDPADIKVPWHAVISLHEVNESKWAKVK